MTDRWTPFCLTVANLERASARVLFSLWTCWNEISLNLVKRFFTKWKYCWSKVSLTSYSFVSCPMTRRKSPLQIKLVISNSTARWRPTIIASYSAWLFEILNSNFMACSMTVSPGPSSTTPAPHERLFGEPFTYNVHLDSPSSVGWGVSYVAKSARAWDLMAPRGWYSMWNSDSLIAQPIIRPTKSGLVRIFIMG